MFVVIAVKPPRRTATLRASVALATAALALNAAGCATSRRQVMLILKTNIPCPTIDRVTIRLSRGAGSTDYTWQRTFALGGAACATAGNGSFPQVPLTSTSEYRLGIVDSRRTEERVRIEVEATGQVTVRALAETDFVDDMVYAVPMDLSSQCIGPDMCASGFACRVIPGTASAGCGSVYRRPGTLGTFAMASALTSDDETDVSGP